MSISCRLWKLDSERDNFGKKTFFDSKTSKRIRLWINFFTTCQNMNRKFYKASSFETKIIFGSLKSVGKTVFKNPVSWVILHQKNVENGTTAFSGKQKSGEKKKTFESSFLRSLKFWINCFDTRQILIQAFWTGLFLSQLFKSRQFWNWKFKKVSDNQTMWEVFFQKKFYG